MMSGNPTFKFDGWTLDTGRRWLRDPEGKNVRLSSQEHDVLAFFCEHPRQLLTREQLAKRHGRADAFFDWRAIDVSITRLRKKIGDDGRNQLMIKTVRVTMATPGGYWFSPEVSIEKT